MCQKAKSSGAGAGADEGAGSRKKMLGAGAATKQAGSETLFVILSISTDGAEASPFEGLQANPALKPCT